MDTAPAVLQKDSVLAPWLNDCFVQCWLTLSRSVEDITDAHAGFDMYRHHFESCRCQVKGQKGPQLGLARFSNNYLW